MWRAADDKQMGERIIVSLFTSKPDLRRFFGLKVEPHEGENLYDSVVVKVHGCRLYGFLENIVHLMLNAKSVS